MRTSTIYRRLIKRLYHYFATTEISLKPKSSPPKKTRVKAAKPKQKNRPVSIEQKEFFRFFNIKINREASYREANEIIYKYKLKLSENKKDILDEWDHYNDLLFSIIGDGSGDTEAADFRKDNYIRKPSRALFWKAVMELRKTEHDYDSVWEEEVVDKLLELNPSLERE